MVNSVIIEGNLTRDVEVKYSNSGTAIASLSIAFNDNYKKGTEEIKQTSFFDVTAFKDCALSCATFVKGNAVHVEGKLVQDRWKDSEGKDRSKVKIVAFKINPMFRNGSAPSNAPRPSAPSPRPVVASASPASDDAGVIPF